MAIKRVVKRSADADSVTLQEAFEDFMQEKRARSLSESTLRNYEQSYNFFCKYAGYIDTSPYTYEEEKDAEVIHIKDIRKG